MALMGVIFHILITRNAQMKMMIAITFSLERKEGAAGDHPMAVKNSLIPAEAIMAITAGRRPERIPCIRLNSLKR